MTYEPSNPLLYSFKGSMEINGTDLIAISNESIILRGCVLKNTDYVYGLVVYNGHFTKLMKNNVKTQEKKSMLEEKMNYYIILVFCFLVFFCFLGSILYIIWVNDSKENHPYLEIDGENLFSVFFIRFFNWVLIFGNFVPISLVVTVETVKFFQAMMLDRSEKLKDNRGELGNVNSSNLNEELG